MATQETTGAGTGASQPAASETPSKWIPLESNPAVMNEWANKLGLAIKRAAFSDVYGLDPDLLALVPQPSQAIILIFPLSDKIDKAQREEDEKIKSSGPQNQIDPTIFYIKQTIPNACGTIALLHALGNVDVTLGPTSSLSRFFELCAEKTPEERADLLEHTPLFTAAHVQAAQKGQTSIPNNLDTDLHFVTFVAAPDPTAPLEDEYNKFKQRVVELDGRRYGPVDHGETSKATFLKDVAKIVKDKYIDKAVSLNFGMISLGPPGEQAASGISK